MFWILLSSNLKDEQLSSDENIPFSFLWLMLSGYLSPTHTFCTLENIHSYYESPCPSCLNSVDHKELNVPQAPKAMWVCGEAAVGQVIRPRHPPLPPPLKAQAGPAQPAPHPCFGIWGFSNAQLDEKEKG